MKRLNEVLGTNQIFTRIMSQHSLPWATDSSVSATLLDFEYRYNFSGNKITAPAVDKSLGDDGIITSAAFNTLCDVAYMMYGKKWARYWEVLTAEFDPIKNYDMQEVLQGAHGNTQTHSGTDTDRHTGTDTVTHSGTDTLTQTGTDTNVRTGTDTNVKAGSHSEAHTGSTTDSGNRNAENEVSAFNSSTYQDNTKDTETNGNTRTHNDTITTTYNNETDTRTYGSLTDQQTKNLTNRNTKDLTDRDTKDLSDATTYGHIITDAGNDSHVLTRSGNIGVTTSQQMLESSLELWKWNFFYDVFKDIDSVFTISTY